ncbi:hypothetical protein HC928_12380 [bacterium]|nr:hypothetical protein [bacterium]
MDFDAGTIYAQADVLSTSPLQTTLGLDPIPLSLKETGTITTPIPDLLPGTQVLNLQATASNGGQIISNTASPLDGLFLDLQAQYDINLTVDVLPSGQIIATDVGTIQSTLNYEFSAPGYRMATQGRASGVLRTKVVSEPSLLLISLVCSAWMVSHQRRRN